MIETTAESFAMPTEATMRLLLASDASERTQTVTLTSGRRVVLPPMGMMNLKSFEEFYFSYEHYIEILGRTNGDFSTLSDGERKNIEDFYAAELAIMARCAVGLPMGSSTDLDVVDSLEVVMAASQQYVKALWVFNWFYRGGECLKYGIPMIPENITFPCADYIMNLFIYDKEWDGEFVMEQDIISLVSADLQIHSV